MTWPRKRVARAVPEAEACSLETPKSRRLCEEIAKRSAGVCLLSFSRGKDSIAAWLYLRKFFKTIIPFHLASVPHLSFADESLSYYEKIFNTRILRFVQGGVLSGLKAMLYQPQEDEPIIDALPFPDYDNHAVADHVRKISGNLSAWCAYGISMNDSIDRRIYVKKYGGKVEKHKSFYPCFDWKRKMVLDTIAAHDVKLPKDYLLANRSFAGTPTYRHLFRMEKDMPKDFARVEEMFPLIRAEIARWRFREIPLVSKVSPSDAHAYPIRRLAERKTERP